MKQLISSPVRHSLRTCTTKRKRLAVRLLSALICVGFSATHGYCQGQDFYYTFKDARIYLTKVSGKYLTEFPNGLDSATGHPGVRLSNTTFFVTDTSLLSDYSPLHFVTPTFVLSNGAEITYTRTVVLKFKPGVSEAAKGSLIIANGLTFVKATPLTKCM